MRIIRIVDRTFDAEENRGFLDNEANEATIKIEAQNQPTHTNSPNQNVKICVLN